MSFSVRSRPTVRADDLCYAYTGHEVLHAVSASLTGGAVTAITGPNGAGKSTLVELLAGVRRPDRGRVVVDGSVALVVQRPAAPDSLPLTVSDVVRLGTWHHDRCRRISRGTSARRVASAIERVGLTGLERRPLASLSGGQRQRALLAQGLVQRAEILLLDEPAAGLDAASRRRTREILAEEAHQYGVAVGCVTHEEESIDVADRVIRLEDGHVIDGGSRRSGPASD